MPFVRIDLPVDTSASHRRAIGDAVQNALHAALDVPLEERFQVIAAHGPDGLVLDPRYLGIERSQAAIIVQVTLNRGRDAARKQAFFRAAVEALQREAGVRPSDVVISLVEVGREDWSFGDGQAQLA